MTTLRNNNGKDTSWNYWRKVRREETTIHETSKKQEDLEVSREEETKEERERITEEEIENAVRRLKKKKATDEDRLKNEVWINAERGNKGKTEKIIGKIWNGEKLSRGSRHNILNT